MDSATVDSGAGARADIAGVPAWRDPRWAVREVEIVCLVCERAFRQITNTHLRRHQLTAAEYKSRFGYNRRRPLMCLALRRLYSERAVRSNLASHIGRRPIVLDPELRRVGGRRPMSLEERLTRLDGGRRRGGLREDREPPRASRLSARGRRRGSPRMERGAAGGRRSGRRDAMARRSA
jgi:hypothetical protein